MSSIQKIVVEGALTKKKFHAPQEQHVCGNCGTEYKGYYCPNCGQKYNVERLTFTSIFKHTVEGITGFTPNLPRTLIDLFYRPGYLVSDYIQQKRRDYSNPFSTVLVLATSFILLNKYVYRSNLTEASLAYSEKLLDRQTGSDEISSAMQAQIAAQTEMMNSIFDNYGIFLLSTLLVIVFPMWIAFRSKRPGAVRLNFCECATASAYYSCLTLEISMIFGWLLRSPETFGLYTLISYAIALPLLALML